MAAEQGDALRHRVRSGHVAAGIPERFAVACIGVVVPDQEVADLLHFQRTLRVAGVDVGCRESGIGEQRQQSRDAALQQMDAGGFQRLHESAVQPRCHHVGLAGLSAPPGDEAQQAWFGLRLPIQVRKQSCRRLVLADVAAAEHVTVADAVLQGNAVVVPTPVWMTQPVSTSCARNAAFVTATGWICSWLPAVGRRPGSWPCPTDPGRPRRYIREHRQVTVGVVFRHEYVCIAICAGRPPTTMAAFQRGEIRAQTRERPLHDHHVPPSPDPARGTCCKSSVVC